MQTPLLLWAHTQVSVLYIKPLVKLKVRKKPEHKNLDTSKTNKWVQILPLSLTRRPGTNTVLEFSETPVSWPVEQGYSPAPCGFVVRIKRMARAGGRGGASTVPAHKRLSKWPWTVNNLSPQPAGARPMFAHHWPPTESLAAFSQHRRTPPGSPGQTLMCQSSTGNQICPKMRPKMLPLQLFPCSTPAPSC